MQRILAIDQSLTASAAVVLKVEPDFTLSIEQQYVHSPKSTGIYRLMDVAQWVETLVRQCQDYILVRELHNQRQFGAANQLQQVGGYIDQVAYRSGLLDEDRYLLVTPGTWKKFCLGKGNVKKDTAYMMVLNKFFKKTPLLNVTQEITDDNIGDAVCLGACGYIAYILRRDIELHDSFVTSEQRKPLVKVLECIFNYGTR